MGIPALASGLQKKFDNAEFQCWTGETMPPPAAVLIIITKLVPDIQFIPPYCYFYENQSTPA